MPEQITPALAIAADNEQVDPAKSSKMGNRSFFKSIATIKVC